MVSSKRKEYLMKSKVFELIKQKELAERRTIPVSEIMEKTGVARNTLKAWLSDKPLEIIYVDVAAAIAEFLGCQWHELFELVEAPEGEN
jgi:transcriptional regulator with XRE-family HTH domain